MQIVIDIPDKEFGIEIYDKFQDFFNRLKVETKAHLISNTNLVCGAYELETIDMFLKAFNNDTPLPKGHGRLIDISDIEPMSYTVDGGDYYDDYKAIDWEDIEKAPTIIEAESEEEK